MNATSLAIVAVTLVSSLGTALAEPRQVAYPQAGPQFTVEVPDTWKPVYR